MTMHLTKIISFSFFLALSIPSFAVEVGDPVQDVRLELGNPDGEIRAGEYHVYIYPRGEIEFTDGVVSDVRIVDEETYRQQQRDLERAVQKQQQERQKMQEANAVEATQAMNEILADPAYTNQPPERRIEIWDEFQTKYPDQSIPEEVAKELEDDQKTLDEEKQKIAQASKPPIVEEKKPRLSGSKSKKLKRGAGKVKPEDRPPYMTRQTLYSKDP